MRLLGYYSALLRAELAATAQYRLQLVVGILGWVVPFVMIALWRSAAADAPIEGIAADQFTTYFIGILLITSNGVMPALVFGFGQLVHSGQLSVLLLRPFHPLHSLVARQLAENAVKLGPLVVICVVVVRWLDGVVSTSPVDWALAFALAVFGIVNTAYVGAIVGSLALWTTKSEGFQSLVFGVEWIAAGVIAPVALLPLGLGDVVRLLPFWLGLGAPSELVAELLPARSAIVALMLSVAWTVVLDRLLRFLWRRGMVQYEAVGT